MRQSVSSTNVFVHVEATRAAAGLGLLPCFMADRHDDLIRVLPDWKPRNEIIHAVFSSRRGLLPSVRLLIEHLAASFQTLDEE